MPFILAPPKECSLWQPQQSLWFQEKARQPWGKKCVSRDSIEALIDVEGITSLYRVVSDSAIKSLNLSLFIKPKKTSEFFCIFKL